ncbi:hypothetical protein F8M41_000215 [Gigaspora margarita]|uniref:Uncharacterized protein n=1 Tax=Gigaspora margarita TaxID=4874 RepID=A0A8H3XGD7_GIGMA|nr:hypothetical protein F8M41_000215 [Gigaspora margarita]
MELQLKKKKRTYIATQETRIELSKNEFIIPKTENKAVKILSEVNPIPALEDKENQYNNSCDTRDYKIMEIEQYDFTIWGLPERTNKAYIQAIQKSLEY